MKKFPLVIIAAFPVAALTALGSNSPTGETSVRAETSDVLM